METSAALDLPAYLARVGYTGNLSPTRSVLEGLHLAHATHIPFENLDILLGRPIRLDLASLQSKLVDSRRGGYCFEQNLLFAAVLRELGFAVTQLAARVRYRTAALLPRTHMLLMVDVAGERLIADVGFGAEGLILPVPMSASQGVSHFAWRYRVIEEDRLWVLQSLHDGSWHDLYAFSLEPQLDVDYQIANHYVSTHPDSRFVQTLTAQLQSPGVRYILRDLELVEDHGNAHNVRSLADDKELLAVLESIFKLPFPTGTRFSRRREES